MDRDFCNNRIDIYFLLYLDILFEFFNLVIFCNNNILDFNELINLLCHQFNVILIT